MTSPQIQFQASRYVRLANWEGETSAAVYHAMTGETFLVTELACYIISHLLTEPLVLDQICQLVSNKLDVLVDEELEQDVTQLLQSLYQTGLLKRFFYENK